jgi:hypothetical protein
LQRKSGVLTPNILTKKSEEGPLWYCKTRPKSDDCKRSGFLCQIQCLKKCKHTLFIYFLKSKADMLTHCFRSNLKVTNFQMSTTSPNALLIIVWNRMAYFS